MQIVQMRQIMQIGQIWISDGCSTVVQVDWRDGIGLRYRAPYGATLKKTLTAIFINNIIFEIIGPFCHVNFIYTYPIQDQLELFQIFIIKVNSFC